MNIDFLYVEGKRQLPPKEEVLRELEERFKKINDPQTLLIKQALKEHFEEIYK
jgi:acyl CoA:acetate/3-ketoacid CoA transferase